MKNAVLGMLLLTAIIPLISQAQAIDNTESFRNIHSDRYFRIYYENDFFTGKDRDYTQGIYIEKVHPAVRNFFLSKLLWRPKNGHSKYGLALEQDAYTPNYIDRSAIQYGDRPYAADLMLKTFQTTVNSRRRERIATVLSVGVIGQWAGGEQMQKTIHHWINYTRPEGWYNQISNDLVLNYQLNYEKQLFALGQWLSVSSYNMARLGTLSDKLATGLAFQVGHFQSSFQTSLNAGKRNPQWYLFYQPLINGIIYDASLQGGLFNRSSPYIIESGNIRRFTFQNKYGIVLILKKLYLEYYQTAITEEFNTSVFHRTGGLQIGFGF